MRFFWRKRAAEEDAAVVEPDVPETDHPGAVVGDPGSVTHSLEPLRRGLQQQPSPEEVATVAEVPEEIRVRRTLVKSEPEIEGLIASDPRFGEELVEVTLRESGFGTSVAIAARPQSDLVIEDLEAMLDALAEDQRRPFQNT